MVIVLKCARPTLSPKNKISHEVKDVAELLGFHMFSLITLRFFCLAVVIVIWVRTSSQRELLT